MREAIRGHQEAISGIWDGGKGWGDGRGGWGRGEGKGGGRKLGHVAVNDRGRLSADVGNSL